MTVSIDRTRSVLWIDDDVREKDPLVVLLGLAGYQVATVQTGEQGLAQLSTVRYAALLLDLQLPDVPGLRLLERIRSRPLTLPVIVITGYATVEAAAEAMRLGAVDLLQKPVFDSELVKAVDAALQPYAVATSRRCAVRRLCERLLGVIEAMDDDLDAEARREVVVSEVIRVLAVAISDPSCPHRLLAACTTMVQLMHCGLPVDEAIQQSQARMQACLATLDAPLHPTVIRILDTLVSCKALLTESDVAALVAVPARAVGDLLRQETGRLFRDWRTLLRLFRRAGILPVN